MDKIYIKTRAGYEQSGIAIKSYLNSKFISAEIFNQKEYNKNRNAKVIELGDVHCVNTFMFSNLGLDRRLDLFYFGRFSFNKLGPLSDKSVKNLHIYSETRWPIHNFINLATYKDLNYLANSYNRFIWLPGNNDEWIYQTFCYCNCKPEFFQDIPIVTVEDYAKELGI